MILRLDKWICDKTEYSRSQVKELLKKNRIKVNDYVEKDGGRKLDTVKDRVTVDGESVIYLDKTYIVLNKPEGFVTSTSEEDGPSVMSLIKDIPTKNLFPVGRLDKDTEGLLLITDDGELSHKLLSPKHHVPKTYFVRGISDISDDDLNKLRVGVDIGDEELTKEASTERVNAREINLTITEGRFHQVKRMLKAINNEVVYLKRISFGNLILENLNITKGEYRLLNEEEIILLKGKAGN